MGPHTFAPKNYACTLTLPYHKNYSITHKKQKDPDTQKNLEIYVTRRTDAPSPKQENNYRDIRSIAVEFQNRGSSLLHVTVRSDDPW